jgi:hypothetical protein
MFLSLYVKCTMTYTYIIVETSSSCSKNHQLWVDFDLTKIYSIILYFSILLHWCITRSLISVSNATNNYSQCLFYFKVPLKSHLIATCFGLTRPSSPVETAALHQFVCQCIPCYCMSFENECSLFAPRYFHTRDTRPTNEKYRQRDTTWTPQNYNFTSLSQKFQQ